MATRDAYPSEVLVQRSRTDAEFESGTCTNVLPARTCRARFATQIPAVPMHMLADRPTGKQPPGTLGDRGRCVTRRSRHRSDQTRLCRCRMVPAVGGLPVTLSRAPSVQCVSFEKGLQARRGSLNIRSPLLCRSAPEGGRGRISESFLPSNNRRQQKRNSPKRLTN